MKLKYDMLTILGATAGGKTSLAAKLALELNGEVISADSRQVYRGMDLGTGKDIKDYTVGGKEVTYHLIDIVEAGKKYNVFEYQQDFLTIYKAIKNKNKFPVLCGGSGMYLEAVLKGYKLIQVPANEPLRKELEKKSTEELIETLRSYRKLHNTSDTDSRKRLIRAIEIEKHNKEYKEIDISFPVIKSLIVGVKFDRNTRRKRISQRLKERLELGMVDEVKQLIDKGVSKETLVYYGLEYKYITQFILGQISYDEMFKKLETAIHQFAKRQMTWFRGMERKGFKIHWLDGYSGQEEKTERIMNLLVNN